MKIRLASIGLLLLLPSCAGGISGSLLQGAATGALAGIAPVVTSAQILQSAADYHNLKIGLEQIEQAPGMVSTVSSAPMVGTPTMPAITPAPTPAPPVMTPTPSTGPTIVTPTP